MSRRVIYDLGISIGQVISSYVLILLMESSGARDSDANGVFTLQMKAARTRQM